MPDIETDNRATWTAYGTHQLARGIGLPELDRWAWDVPGTGPGAEVLGDVAGLQVLDVGSGLGRHAALLAALGAQVTAVDSSPTQHQRAAARYAGTPGLRPVCADAVDHLHAAAPYDLVHSVSGVPFTDPPAAHARADRRDQARRTLRLHRAAHQLPRRRTLVTGSTAPRDAAAARHRAAVRELAEESGPVADPGPVRVLGTLLDRVGDVVRVTVPVLVTRWSGTPQQREEGLRARRFRPTEALPGPLFVPTAQCLTAWDPALPPDHPAAWFQPYGSSTGPATTADATRSTW